MPGKGAKVRVNSKDTGIKLELTLRIELELELTLRNNVRVRVNSKDKYGKNWQKYPYVTPERTRAKTAKKTGILPENGKNLCIYARKTYEYAK